ncbi:translocation/assembly module TamB domain-containing protein [Corallococcus silvisoli]|uniref:translocation/assembly module TamB domain-containing protein n=1 Tax=Corallococcus silvisoli TaxID=2697031 RepID=UPI0013790DBD|nr:translocation/assembly module TamB domain-containing protein [Corallococcus silvisoli]NBD12445.1 translocation/assembly module TamB [Corallococcus silvisoli]
MSEPTTPAPAPPHRRPRWGRRLLWGLLGLLGLIVLLGVGALVFATSAGGSARIARLGVDQVNKQLAGRLELGGFDLDLDGAVLTGVKLYTPEGELVAEVARVEARLNLSPLLSQRVDLTKVRIETPRLYLVQDERGLNLMRALEPREPKPEEPPTQSQSALRILLKDFELSHGFVDFRQELPDGGERQVRLEELGAKGAGHCALADMDFAADLQATGGLTRPLTGPVSLALKGQGKDVARQVEARLGLAGVEADLGAKQTGEKAASVELRKLVVPPGPVKAFVPAYPLVVPVEATGTASLDGDVARAKLGASAGKATLDLTGDVNLKTLRTTEATVKARGVNLAELMEDGIPTRIAADLTAHGGGDSVETLEGDVALTVSPSEYRGQSVGPIELKATAKDGHYQVGNLRVLMPGAALIASGQGTAKSLEARGSLSAGDLKLLSQALDKLLPGGTVPPMSGSGSLEFQVQGPPRSPGVKADGNFVALNYGDIAIKDLSLKANVRDVTRPLTTDATVLVSELKTGGRTFRDLSAALTTSANRELKASVRVDGDAKLAVGVEGTVDADNEGLAMRTFSLSWPEATWTLQQPTHLAFGGGRIALAPPLSLVSESQTLKVAAVKDGERVDARIDLGAFDLSKLPRLAVPESLGLGGMLSGHVAAKGRLTRPDADVDLAWVDGRARGYTGLGLQLKAQYSKDRATGTLAASLSAGHVSSQFDVPVQGVLRRRNEPLSLTVNLEKLDVAEALKLAGQPPGPSGQIAGRLTVTGSAKDPRLGMKVVGDGLRYPGRPEDLFAQTLGFELNANSDENDATLGARLDVKGLAPQAYVVLKTPFTLSGLIAKPPTPARALETPLRLEVLVAELPLRLLQGMEGVDKPDGMVTLKADVTGTALAPVGRVELQGRAVTANGLPPLNGSALVLAGDDDVKLTLDVQRPNGPLATLEARVLAPLGSLQDREVAGRVPFRLKGRVGPVPLDEIPGLVPQQGHGNRGPQGVLSMELVARGTPEAPEVELNAGLQGLGVAQTALGQARLHYSYSEAKSLIDAMLTAPGGGSLVLGGTMELDLSLPALQSEQGPAKKLDRAPVELSLRARRFDPTFLSGISPYVRTLGGFIQADANLGGTVGAPTFKGSLGWKDGRLGLMGFGEYNAIQLALNASQERIELKQLTAKSGNGTLELTATANRQGKNGEFMLEGKGNTKNLPIVVEDQLLALLSLNLSMKGSLTDRLVNISDLSIPEAHVELPEAKRKDLQPLERPADVVMVRNGVPVDKRKRKQPTPAQVEAEQKAANPRNAPDAPGTPGNPGTPATSGGAGNPPSQYEPPQAEPRLADLENSEEEEEEAPQRQFWVNINAPRNLWVRGSDLNIQLGLSEGFRVEYANEARMFGEVMVLLGRVDVLGRRFDVQRDSQVRFTGPVLTPYINVTAEYRNENAAVTVYVTVRGQGKDITLKTSSDPALPESEIYTLLATGRRTLERGSGASVNAGAQAASVVGSYVANEARKAIAAKLPLDVLSIEAGDSGIAGTKLEVGTYVTDKIYVGYTGRVGANLQKGENANAVRFQYLFSPRWSLEGMYGDARSGGLDLIWTKEY